MSKTTNDPIHLMATFTDKAIPMEGLKVPPAAFTGRSRTAAEQIHLMPHSPEQASSPMNVSLIASLGKQLQSTAESILTPLDAGVLRTWLAGSNERDAAAELKVSVQEIRAAREQLLRRIHVTIDPPSS